MFVLILQFLWQYIDDLVGKGLEWYVICQLIFYISSSTLVMMALPLATLLASSMALGNLGEHNELLALKSAGISLHRILAPLMLLVAGVFAVGGFWYANRVQPYFFLRFTSLMYDVRRQRPELQIKEGIFYDGITNYTIRVQHKDEQTGLLSGLMIYDHSANNGNRSLTMADSGYIRITADKKYLVLTLYDGNSYEEMNEQKGSGGERKYPFRTNSFAKQEAMFELTGYGFERTDESLFKDRAKMLNLNQLTVMADSLQRDIGSRTQLLARNFFTSGSFRYGSTDFLNPHKPYRLNTDSLFATFDVRKQHSVAHRALELAMQAQSSYVIQAGDMQYERRDLNMHNIEWHLKFSLPFSCVVFFLIGAPLGAIIRKGGFGTPFLVSLLVFLVYYMVSFAGERLARDSVWTPRSAIWMSTLVTLPMGIFFAYKAAADKSIAMPQWLAYAIGQAKRLLQSVGRQRWFRLLTARIRLRSLKR
jgi:lipopolysaccharide export system permease protein